MAFTMKERESHSLFFLMAVTLMSASGIAIDNASLTIENFTLDAAGINYGVSLEEIPVLTGQ